MEMVPLFIANSDHQFSHQNISEGRLCSLMYLAVPSYIFIALKSNDPTRDIVLSQFLWFDMSAREMRAFLRTSFKSTSHAKMIKICDFLKNQERKYFQKANLIPTLILNAKSSFFLQ